MNITHAVDEEIQGDRLQAIFNRQKSLMEKYHYIEEASGLLQTPDCPINLNDKRGQARIKDFSWRVTEELGEALDARHDEEHFQEELIDGLHFLTELTILAGKDYNSILAVNPTPMTDELNALVYSALNGRIPRITYLPEAVTYFIEQIAMMCNCLKNKPWKQSQMPTDIQAFYYRLGNVWLAYVNILCIAGMDADTITNTYLKKSQVNQFRQRSNY